MRLATILALASLGALIALALRVLAMRSRGQRTSRSDRKVELVERGEAPSAVLSDQTEISIPVTDRPPATPIEDDTRTENGPDIPHPVQREPAPAPEAGVGAVADSDIPDAGVAIDKQIQPSANEDLDGGDVQLPDGHRGVSPGNRGGRPRTAAPEGEGGKAGGSRWRFQKPEVVCWNKSREWILAVELPNELEEAEGVSVSHNGMVLSEDELERGCWLDS